MSVPGAAPELRPLGLGEIFDRAVTIYVRNFGVFLLLGAIVVVPFAVYQYFAPDMVSSYQQALQQLSHPGKAPQAVPLIGFGNTGFAVFIAVVGFLLTPFQMSAAAGGVANVYTSVKPTFRNCLAYALRRWASLLGLAFWLIVVVAVVVFALALALVGIVAVVVFALRQAAGLALGLAISATVIWFFVAFAVIMLCYLAVMIAFDTTAIEQANAVDALSRGFSRVFNRRELLRAIGLDLGLVAVYLGFYMVLFGGVALAEILAHSNFLNTLVYAALSLLTTSFVGVLVAVYYFDLRVRREGLDLEAAIGQLEIREAT